MFDKASGVSIQGSYMFINARKYTNVSNIQTEISAKGELFFLHLTLIYVELQVLRFSLLISS